MCFGLENHRRESLWNYEEADDTKEKTDDKSDVRVPTPAKVAHSDEAPHNWPNCPQVSVNKNNTSLVIIPTGPMKAAPAKTVTASPLVTGSHMSPRIPPTTVSVDDEAKPAIKRQMKIV